MFRCSFSTLFLCDHEEPTIEWGFCYAWSDRDTHLQIKNASQSNVKALVLSLQRPWNLLKWRMIKAKFVRVFWQGSVILFSARFIYRRQSRTAINNMKKYWQINLSNELFCTFLKRMSQTEGEAGSSRLKMLIGVISKGEATHVREGSRQTGSKTDEAVWGNVFAWQGGEEEQGGQQRGRAILIQIVENNKIPEEISEVIPPSAWLSDSAPPASEPRAGTGRGCVMRRVSSPRLCTSPLSPPKPSQIHKAG